MVSETVLIWCILGFLFVMFREFSSQPKRQTQRMSSVKKESRVATPQFINHFAFGSWRPRNVRSTHSFTAPTRFTRYDSEPYHWRRQIHRRTLYDGVIRPSRPLRTTREKGNVIVETWRKSIVGLVELADRNLESARQNLEVRNYEAAVQITSTSVENIARALIHCCGGKPDPGSGQEEALRILSRRFEGEEKNEFEKALDDAACISHNRIVLRYLSTHNVQTQLFDDARSR